jgi:sugar lactone lactonase YvrE
MYIVGSSGDAVYQYTLGTPWDVSTASYASKSFSIASQETGPGDITFKPDGTTMYLVGSTSDIVFQYTLSTPWDISTASYASKSFSVASQESVSSGITFNSNGSRMYIVGSTTDTVFQYSLATAWDVSTASYDGVGLYINDTAPSALALRDDDSRLYVVGTGGDAVRQYNLPEPGNLQTPGYFDTQSFSVSAQESTPREAVFKPDGTTMYVVGETNDTVYQYTLSTPWDVSTASYASKSFSVSAQELTPQALAFKPDGSRMYVAGSAGDDINEYSLSTPWDVTTASYVQLFSVAAQETTPNSMYFRSDGLKLYVIGSDQDRVFQYTLGTAWNISTASYDNINFSTTAQDTAPTGLYFKNDGTLMFVVGSTNDNVYQYALSTPWDVSTAQYQNLAFNVRSQAAGPQSVVFRETDGTSMYVLDLTSQKAHQSYLR